MPVTRGVLRLPSRSTATTCAACRCSSARRCWRACVPPLGRASRYGDHVDRARRGVLRGRGRAWGSRGSSPSGPTSRYTGRPHARLDQDQVPAPPGVRDRRLHRAAGRARLVRRAPPRRLRGRTAASTSAGRHRLRRARRSPASWERLAAARAATTSPFDAGTPAGRGHHWVEPRLVCEVRFTEWTRRRRLRHPRSWAARRQASRRSAAREAAPVEQSAEAPRRSSDAARRAAGRRLARRPRVGAR